MAKIIDGRAHAKKLKAQVKDAVDQLREIHGLTPGLAVVLVGDDPASSVYVKSKEKAAKAAGIAGSTHILPASASREELLGLIDKLNTDPAVHGILVQLPLPSHLDETEIINAIAVKKDVDGFHIDNAGRLATGQQALIPCTPLGCLKMLKAEIGNLSGLHAVVIGRSNIVGKPMAQLLLRENCTVTIAHSRTRDLPEVCRGADILVAAVGQPGMVKGDWVKEGATVIDVGINRGGDRLVGDVDFDDVEPKAGAITPVPGGVGPMTIACLLSNTVTAACRSAGYSNPLQRQS
ncbi:bifunctional methylenetetrahydrofolate dehydrogenase/methenyltetrahydrofolate cyclohydrolase FolD [Paracoccaceae bacterium GXU_MW_L88]